MQARLRENLIHSSNNLNAKPHINVVYFLQRWLHRSSGELLYPYLLSQRILQKNDRSIARTYDWRPPTLAARRLARSAAMPMVLLHTAAATCHMPGRVGGTEGQRRLARCTGGLAARTGSRASLTQPRQRRPAPTQYWRAHSTICSHTRTTWTKK